MNCLAMALISAMMLKPITVRKGSVKKQLESLYNTSLLCAYLPTEERPRAFPQARYNWGPHVWVGGTHAPSLFGPSCETTYFWSVVLPFIIIIISLDTLVSKLSVHLYHRK